MLKVSQGLGGFVVVTLSMLSLASHAATFDSTAISSDGLVFWNDAGEDAGNLWQIESCADAADGRAARQMASVIDDCPGLLTTTNGPGTLTWRWKHNRQGSLWAYVSGNGFYESVYPNDDKPSKWEYCSMDVACPGQFVAGWEHYGNKDGAEAWVDDVRWIPAPATVDVSFVSDGVTVTNLIYVTGVSRYGYDATGSYVGLPELDREGYEFVGWFFDANLMDPVEEGSWVEFSRTTLYAGWLVNINEALDNAGPEFTCDGYGVEWRGQDCADAVGGSAVCCRPGKWGEGWLNATFEGPGTLTFKCKQSVSGGFFDGNFDGHLEVLFDGENSANCGSLDFWDCPDYYEMMPGGYWGYFYTEKWVSVRRDFKAAGPINVTWSYYGYERDAEAWLDDVQWTPAPASVTITFDTQGGVLDGSPSRAFSTGVRLGEGGAWPANPTRSGWTFVGWVTADGTAVDSMTYVPLADAVYYAIWRTGDFAKVFGDAPFEYSTGGDSPWHVTTRVTGEAQVTSGNLPIRIPAWWKGTRACGRTVATSNYLEMRAVSSVFVTFKVEDYGVVRCLVDGKEVKTRQIYVPQGSVLRIEYLPYAYDYELYDWESESYREDQKTAAAVLVDFGFEVLTLQDSLPDWARKVFEGKTWIEGNIPALEAQYAARTDPEGCVLHALTTLVALGEDSELLALLSRCGGTLSYMPLDFDGAPDVPNFPASNEAVDLVISRALQAVDVAANDLSRIPDSWSGSFAMTPEVYFLDETVYADNGDIQILKAVVEGARAALYLARGYDWSANYETVQSYTNRAVHKILTQEKIMADFPAALTVRDRAALETARKYLRNAWVRLQVADAAICARPASDTNLHFFEYDSAYADEFADSRRGLQALIDSLDRSIAVDPRDYLCWARVKEKYRTELASSGVLDKHLYLGALFDGVLTRDVIPTVKKENGYIPIWSELPDATAGGFVPDATAAEWEIWWSLVRNSVFPYEAHRVVFDLGAHGTSAGLQRIVQLVQDGKSPVEPICTADPGWRFAGWDREFAVVTSDLTVNAIWARQAVSDHAVVVATKIDVNSAVTLDGYLNAGDALAGSIQVKLAKAGKNGLSKLTATIAPAGGKKTTVTGTFDPTAGTFVATAKDGTVLELVIGADGFYGTFGAYEIDGARNLYSSKDADDKAAVAAADKWVGSYAIVCEQADGCDILSVTIAKKGKVKVSGTLADGSKVSVSAQMIIGSERCCIPVVYVKKNVSLAFTIWLGDEDLDIVGLDGAVFGKAGNLEGASALKFDAGALEALMENETTEVLTTYLPNGAEIGLNGTKWVVMPDEKGKAMKTGKLVWDKKTGAIDETKSKIDGYNVSGLKLTYTAKTGSFKGSFKVYTLVKGVLKNTSATVSGIVVDGVAYGSATVKKAGSVAVEIGK